MVQRPSVVFCQRCSQCSNIFFSETAGPIKARLYLKPPWIGGAIFFLWHLDRVTKMAATPMYGKIPSKSSQEPDADFQETWYVASGTPANHNLFK